MSESKKFQKKKLNKEYNKKIKNFAKGLKGILGGVGAFALITPIIKKDIFTLGKKIIFKE